MNKRYFKPDIELKKSLMYANNLSLVYLFNTIFDINLIQKSKFELLSTESITNDNSGDNKVIISDIIFRNLNTNQKYHIEFQTSKDTEMAIRVFIYGLNSAKKDYSNDKALIFPLSHILYFNYGKTKYGEDKIDIVLPKIEFDNITYINKKFTYIVNYTNLLKFSIDELLNSGFSVISYIYFYKYLQDKRKLDSDSKILKFCKQLNYFQKSLDNNVKLTGSDKFNIKKSLYSIITDIVSYVDRKGNISMETKQILDLEYKSIGDIMIEKATVNERNKIIEKMLKDGRVGIDYISSICDISVEDILKLKESF